MSDGMDALARYLAGGGSRQAIAASDPYAGMQGTFGQIGNMVVTSGNRYSLRDRMLGALISGVAGGVFGGLSNSYQARAQSAYDDVLSKTIMGQAVDQPDVLDTSLFQQARQQGSLFKIQQALQERAAATDLANAIQKEAALGQIRAGNDQEKALFEAMLKNPERTLRALGKTPGAEVAPIATPLEKPQPKARVGVDESGALEPFAMSGRSAADVDAAVMPKGLELPTRTATAPAAAPKQGPKTYVDYLQATDGDEEAARLAFKRDMEAPDRANEQITKLRNEFQTRPVFTEFQMVDKGYRSMLKAMQDPNGTSDVELVKGGIQMIEPGLAVNGGEAAAIAGTGALTDQLKAFMLGALNGESRLPPEVRQGIIDIATRRYGEHSSKFNAARDFYVKEAGRMGLPTDSVTYLPAAAPADQIIASLRGPQAPAVDPSAAARAILKARGVPGY